MIKHNNKILAASSKKNIYFSLYTSILSIALCMICLAGATFAWFVASSSIEAQSIVSANASINKVEVYKVTYDVVAFSSIAEDGTETVSESLCPKRERISSSAEFYAESGTKYEITASLGGTAKNKFLLVSTLDGNYYTTDPNCTFELVLLTGGDVEISAVWGSQYIGQAFGNNNKIGKGIEFKPETKSWTVAPQESSEAPSESTGAVPESVQQAANTVTNTPSDTVSNTASHDTASPDTVSPDTPSAEPTPSSHDTSAESTSDALE